MAPDDGSTVLVGPAPASTVGVGPATSAFTSDDGVPLGGEANPTVDGRLVPQPPVHCDRLMSNMVTSSRTQAWHVRHALAGATDTEILNVQAVLNAAAS